MQRLILADSVERLAYRKCLNAIRYPLYAILLLSAIRYPLSAVAFADVVYYKSGDVLKGLVVEEHQDRVVVNTEAGEQTILRKDIDDVFYDDPERNYLYLGNQALVNRDFGLAKGFFHKALQIHPQFIEAQEALHRLEDHQMKLASPEAMRDPLAALESRWGLILEPTGNWPEVKVVRNGSSPLGSEIVAGDLLVSAWGQSLAFLPITQVAQALLGPSGSTVKLTIQRPLHLPKGALPGVIFEMEPLGLTVTKVEPVGVAESTRMRVGDRIVALDGNSTRYLPLAEARRAFQKARDEGITIVIHRDLMIKRR